LLKLDQSQAHFHWVGSTNLSLINCPPPANTNTGFTISIQTLNTASYLHFLINSWLKTMLNCVI